MPILTFAEWQRLDCSRVRLARLFPSESSTIVDGGTIARRWGSHGCSQGMLTRLFWSETDMIIPKWNWHNCFQVTVAPILKYHGSFVDTKERSFYQLLALKKISFIHPEIHNIKVSFIRKIHNMNSSFRAKFIFL